jgi:hypothetical protein
MNVKIATGCNCLIKGYGWLMMFLRGVVGEVIPKVQLGDQELATARNA